MTAPDPSKGFVFAASGAKFAALTEQAARTLRATNPGHAIDIFTDSPVDETLYDRVHALNQSWFRPKFEALIRSRFDQTVYLDADLVVLADISDIFWLLDRFDIAAAHVQNRNAGFARRTWHQEIPNAFPQINGGVLGIRRNDATTAFLEACNKALADENLPADQPVMRELLLDSDLRLAILPPEYNLRKKDIATFSNSNVPAPRILHSSDFHKRMKGLTPPGPGRIYGRIFMRHVRDLLSTDRTLGGRGKTVALYDVHKKLPRWIAEDLRRLFGGNK